MKWFATVDQSQHEGPIQVSCFRTEKGVDGSDWSTWTGWLKLARYLESLP